MSKPTLQLPHEFLKSPAEPGILKPAAQLLGERSRVSISRGRGFSRPSGLKQFNPVLFWHLGGIFRRFTLDPIEIALNLWVIGSQTGRLP